MNDKFFSVRVAGDGMVFIEQHLINPRQLQPTLSPPDFSIELDGVMHHFDWTMGTLNTIYDYKQQAGRATQKFISLHRKGIRLYSVKNGEPHFFRPYGWSILEKKEVKS